MQLLQAWIACRLSVVVVVSLKLNQLSLQSFSSQCSVVNDNYTNFISLRPKVLHFVHLSFLLLFPQLYNNL